SEKYNTKLKRETFVKDINISELTMSCYGEIPSNSYIPKGFLGYGLVKNIAEVNKKKKKKEIESNVFIANGLGSEECVESKFEKYGFNTKRDDINILLKKWKTRSIDSMLIYLEAERT